MCAGLIRAGIRTAAENHIDCNGHETLSLLRPANEWYFFPSAPVGDGVVDNAKLTGKLWRAGFNGILAVEIDFLHPDYGNDEHAAVGASVKELRQLAAQAGASQ